ncbi:MAG: hypothetical protein K5770_17060 [Lachnospiraceae bacterium]|nr:hypothetical protein [Lachnospiraceae bacterium]
MLKDKWKSLSSLRKRLFALTLAVAVLSTSISIGYFAVNADTDPTERVITSFEKLPEEIAYQTVPVGGSEKDIDFPKELKVILYSETETSGDKTESVSVPLDPESAPAVPSVPSAEPSPGTEENGAAGVSDENAASDIPGNTGGENNGDQETAPSSDGNASGNEGGDSTVTPSGDPAGEAQESENGNPDTQGSGTGTGSQGQSSETGSGSQDQSSGTGNVPQDQSSGTGNGSQDQSSGPENGLQEQGSGGQNTENQSAGEQSDNGQEQNGDSQGFGGQDQTVQNPEEPVTEEPDTQDSGLGARALLESLFTVRVQAAELTENENPEPSNNDVTNEGPESGPASDSGTEPSDRASSDNAESNNDASSDDNRESNNDAASDGNGNNDTSGDSNEESDNTATSDENGAGGENEAGGNNDPAGNNDQASPGSSETGDGQAEEASQVKEEETVRNEDKKMEELSSGVSKILKDVHWKLEGYRSAYGNKFQAVRAGDVFVYVPDIEAYDLSCDAPLPEIRVTIVEGEEKNTVSVSDNEMPKEEGEVFSQFMIIDGVKIELTAPKGVFPENAMLVVKKIDDPSQREKIKNVLREDMGLNPEAEVPSEGEETASQDQLSFLSFDISVIDENGEELQPNNEFGEATVTFSNIRSVGDGSTETEISVYHFDDGLDSADSLGVDESGDAVSVTAEHFSTYVVASSRRGSVSTDGSVTDIECSRPDLGLIKGEEYFFPGKGNNIFGATFTVLPANAKKKDIIWTISPNTVDANGWFKAVASEYTITATIKGGQISLQGVVSDYTEQFKVIVTENALVIGGLEYFGLQVNDGIDAYINNQEYIEIRSSAGSKIEYMLLNEFITSETVLDNKKSWSGNYTPTSKPKLKPNQKNYVYAKITDNSNKSTYIGSLCIVEDEIKPVINSVTEKQSGTQATVTVSGQDELSGIKNYYVLAKKANEPAPSASDIINSPSVAPNQSGVFTIQNLQANTAYVFYSVAMDNAGNVSNVAKSGVGALSAVIKIDKYEYTTMQGKDAVDDCYNEQKEIEISLTTAGASATIQYYISDTFISSTSALEKAVNGAWSAYNPDNKPALKQNKVNYIYAKITPPTGDPFYLSSKGIWEDEKPPKVSSVKGTPKDTSADVTVKGTDGESGVEFYYVVVKKREESAPSKPKSVRDDGRKTDDGLFSVDGLEAKTNYTMYAVVTDRAGNISEIKTGKLTTKKSTDASTQGAGAGGAGAGGAGAGAGGAGGAGAAGLKPGESNVDKRTADAEKDKKKEGEEEEDETSIRDRVPFIDDASEGILIGRDKTSGWDRIEDETVKCTAPAEIVIDMNGSTVVPVAMLHDFAERDVTCYFKMDEKATWVLNGLSYTELPKDDVDFRVRLDTKNIPAQKINELADVYPHINFTLSHDGDFGFTALLRLNVGETNHGLHANLYYYNEDDKTLEYVNSSPIDNNGYGVFEFTHASDYTVIIRGDAVTGSKSVLSSEASEEAEETYINAESMKKSSGSKIWLIVISVLSILLCVAILLAPSEKRRRAGRGKA